jgi:hypothetical protein
MKALFVNDLVVILTFDTASTADSKYYFSTFGTLVKLKFTICQVLNYLVPKKGKKLMMYWKQGS